MCIVFFEWTEDRFLVCHNRDEFFSRPTKYTEWWSPENSSNKSNNNDHDDNGNNVFEILAPRDDLSGGTWFGFEKTTGRCAFLTNIRELDSTKYTTSRGEFVVNYLKSDTKLSALEYLQTEFVGGDAAEKKYGGFNLVVFSGRDLAYFSNRYPDDQAQKGPIALAMGTPYGLSNSTLQDPYAKVRKGLIVFEQLVVDSDPGGDNEDHLMDGLERLMQNQEYCPGDSLPRTGEPGFPESVVRQRSSICVPVASGYGTRTTIRFVLEKLRTKTGEGGNNSGGLLWSEETKRRLRCIEKNWNLKTLEWATNADLNCIISVSPTRMNSGNENKRNLI